MDIRKIAVLGSGRLGRGIAEVAASKGYDVVLFSQGAGGQNVAQQMEQSLDKKLAKWAITESDKRVILGKIRYTSDFKELANVDLVVEATVDHLSKKQELLKSADEYCRPEVTFITTSATLSVSDLSLGLHRASSLVGLRFVAPVPVIPVVEMSKAPHTTEQALETAQRFAKKLGKTIVWAEESPGLIVTRALLSLINEAAYMLDEGVASAEGVEVALKESFRMEEGPLEMADRIGLDTVLDWMIQLEKTLGIRFAPCPLIQRYVRKGRLGVKSSLGFFAYTSDGNKTLGAEQEGAE